jgi:hypothetical protein
MKRWVFTMAVVSWIACPPSAMSAEDPTSPGFGTCSPSAKHAAVPKIRHLVYGVARKRLLAGDWTPLAKNPASSDGTAQHFRSKGYREVDACAMDRPLCRFDFADSFGNLLLVFTKGEDPPGDWNRQTVSSTRLSCPIK